MNKQIQKVLLLLLLTLLTVFAGCGFDNTMYNARKYFKSAQSRPLNQNGKPTPQAIDDYTKTIKKCGYILTERKNSPEADDALFLLAQSLYFKGNNQFQAKDQFESLIRNFPDSPYSPQATMFIAQIYRQINEEIKADKILEDYVRNPKTDRWHPMALSLLADFAIQDKDFVKAQFWLEKILDQYPKSQEYKEASFLLGKNYFEQQDYTNSLSQFRRVVGTRSIKETTKLDARYYIALNLLLMKDYQKSNVEISRLLKIEDRPDKIPQLKLLKGRLLLATNKIEEADEILQSIIKSNSKTAISTEAYYRLAEYNFYRKGDTKSAIENYGKAKSEAATSDFAIEATSKQMALTQIYQTKIISIESPQLYIDNKMTSANNFYNVLSLPDSAFAVIDSVKMIPNIIQPKVDSLHVLLSNITAKMDSLNAVSDSSDVQISDSLQTTNTDRVATDSLNAVSDSSGVQTSDSLQTINTDRVASDSLKAVTNSDFNKQDSLSVSINDKLIAPSDSLTTTNIETLPDSTANKPPIPPKPAIKKEVLINQYQQQLTYFEIQNTKLTDVLEQYKNEYIPYTMFFKASLITRTAPDSTQLRNIYTVMVEQYPDNKYTNALNLMLQGKPVRLIDTAMEKEENEFDKALSDIDTTPDSAIVALDRLTQSEYKNIKQKANFRLGWFYTFEQPDTAKAKLYFNEVIKTDILSDYAVMTRKFYSGSKFLFRNNEADSLGSKVLLDSLKFENIPDTLSGKFKEDSLNLTPKNKKEIDSIPRDIKTNMRPAIPLDENINPGVKSQDPVIIKPE